MSTIETIKTCRTLAVVAINRVLLRAAELGIENELVAKLRELKELIELMALDAILDSPEVQQALAVLRSATENLKSVAEVMQNAQAFLDKLAGFVETASDVAGELEKLG